MARIRSIKPEFWTNAQVLECSTNARLLFVGLWNFADDSGRHVDIPKQIKAEIFPADDFTLDDVQGMLDELSKNGLIMRYTVESKDYFTITGWHHQRIDKPQPAKYPGPEKADSKNIPRTLPPDRKGLDGIGNIVDACVDAGKDLLWEAMLAGCGINLKAKHTNSERGAWNKALKELRGAGATPEEIRKRCLVHKQKWPGITVTPNSLAKHWTECGGNAEPLRKQKMLGEE